MRSINQISVTFCLLSMVLTGCAVPAATTTNVPGSRQASMQPADIKNSQTSDEAGFECPVTIPPHPGSVPAKPENSGQFQAPDPWPGEYPHPEMVWYGSDELWTALAVDGNHGDRKSVWWSVNFPGGNIEEQPEVFVTWTRLDPHKPASIDNGGKATNASTSEEGWFIIAGIDPQELGCWEVTATYKGATLSYVYEKKG